MPFTFAHPAAVLPIHDKLKKWLPLSALAIGSMVPDAAYYLPLPAGYKEHAHSFGGALLYALPVGIVVLLIFYWIVADAVGLLPSPQREALQSALPGSGLDKSPALSWSGTFLAICALSIGAETHILWDSFTHDNGWFVLHSPFLQTRLWARGPRILGARGFFVFDALEYLSSIVGLWIVLYLCDRWMKSRGLRIWTRPEVSARLYLWTAVLVGALAEAVVESRTIQEIISLHFLRRKHFVLLLGTAFIRDVLFAVLALAVGVKLVRLVRASRVRPSRAPLPRCGGVRK